ncbi:MAG: lipopolysaccharide biosynthesis protein [Oenococcus sp.]|uniref:lipopolysaccharide biosynthesis protein n=1 Tax=Oenococcus sp. TaxID=1979414 RepID=UPI0039E959AB
MNENDNNIKKELRRGVFYTAIGKYSSLIANFIVNMILSRILSPRDYGIVAALMVFMPFFLLLSELGVGPAIIQSRILNKFDLSSIFKVLTLFSLVLSAVFGFSGFFLVSFYHSTVYYGLAWAMAPILFFSIMAIVPMAIMQREQRFKELNLINFFAYTSGGLSGILAALSGLGYYALVFTNAVPAIMNFLWIYWKSDFHIKKGFSLQSYKKISSYSNNQLGFGLVNYFSRNLDNILVGRFLGPSALGFYNKSYQLLTYPNTVFTAVVTPVLQPVLANYIDDVNAVRESYLKIIRILFLVGIPLSLFLCLNSRLVILFIFGNQWQPAILPFRIFTFSIWIQIVISTTGSIFQAMNLPRLLLILGGVNTLITVSFIVIGIWLGNISTVALLVDLAYFINFFLTFSFLMKNALAGSMSQLFNQMWRPLISGVLPTLMDGLFLYLGVFASSVFLQTIASSVIFTSLWFASIFFTGDLKFIKRGLISD